MKIVVTGASGQLGTEIVGVASAQGHDVCALARIDLDITDAQAVLHVVERERPEVIVHTAAYTAVDACEGDRERAFLTNATGTANVVRAARSVGARVVYISTDYVFDGTKTSPYIESDTPNPRSVYGASKLAGERELDIDRDMVVRVSWVCGFNGANMVKTILRIAAQHDVLTFVDDQIGHPTFADDAARMITRLIADDRRGIWHVTNQGAVSWYEFAREVMRAAGLDPNRVKPVSTHELVPPRPAPRPANSVLDNKRLRDEGIELLEDFRLPLARLVERLRLG